VVALIDYVTSSLDGNNSQSALNTLRIYELDKVFNLHVYV
jgi:predicted phosphatase